MSFEDKINPNKQEGGAGQPAETYKERVEKYEKWATTALGRLNSRLGEKVMVTDRSQYYADERGRIKQVSLESSRIKPHPDSNQVSVTIEKEDGSTFQVPAEHLKGYEFSE